MKKDVTKRDGRVVEFDETRISAAISKAMAETERGVDEALVEKIVNVVKYKAEKNNLSVEQIQDVVENELMKSARKDVAKVYIAYRHQRNLAREAKTKDVFMSIISAENNEITRENANMCAESPAGMMIKFASETTKPFADNYLLTEEALTATRGNYIHPHDKDYMVTRSLTCLQHPLDRILENGFKAGHGESRPAKRIETATILAAISMETVQNEMHGGQSVSSYDHYVAPYVRMTYEEEFEKASELYGYDINIDVRDREIKDFIKKDLSGISDPFERIRQQAINQTIKRTHQASESLIHNLNTIHSRGGNQVVFSSLNYGTATDAFGRLSIRELLLATEEGVGNGSTAIFPIQIFKLKKGVSYLPEDPNYDLYKLACRVSAKRFYPNFLNLDATYNQNDAWDENDPKRYIHEVATMGKQLLLI